MGVVDLEELELSGLTNLVSYSVAPSKPPSPNNTGPIESRLTGAVASTRGSVVKRSLYSVEQTSVTVAGVINAARKFGTSGIGFQA